MSGAKTTTKENLHSLRYNLKHLGTMDFKVDYLNARVDALQRRIEELETTVKYREELIDLLNAQIEIFNQNQKDEFNK